MADTVVLIIDSDETSNQLLSQLLRKMGYKVFTSTSGKDGLMRVNDFLPGAIICDTALPDIGPQDLIERFQQDQRLALSPVVAISERYNADEMELCIKAGYVEYYAKSGTAAIALAESLPRLISARAAQMQKDDRGLLIAFMSAKGGTGTSSLCTNITHALGVGMQPATVALMDLVLPMSSITSITGYEGVCSLADMVQHLEAKATLDAMRECMPAPKGWNFSYLPGSPDPEIASKLPVERLPDVMQAMRSMFNYIVVDLGRMLSQIVMPLILDADLLVLVVGTDHDSVGLSSRLLKYLDSKGVNSDHVFPVLNRAVGLQGLTKAEIDETLGIEVRLTVPYLMEKMALSNNLHIPFITKYPDDSATMVIKQGANDISRQAIKNRSKEAQESS